MIMGWRNLIANGLVTRSQYSRLDCVRMSSQRVNAELTQGIDWFVFFMGRGRKPHQITPARTCKVTGKIKTRQESQSHLGEGGNEIRKKG